MSDQGLLRFFDRSYLFENFLFVANSIPVSQDEEVNTPALQYGGKSIILISADADTTLADQSKPALIVVEEFD